MKEWDTEGSILVIGHRDGDGMSALSVIFQGLQALGFENIDTEVFLSPDITLLEKVLSENDYKYVITGDIGASFEKTLDKYVEDYIIADHHPNKSGLYGKNQLNSFEFDMNDESECSGSTTAFLIFFHVFPDSFWDGDVGKVMLCYAISGAISDFQFKREVISVNKFVLDIAIKHHAIDVQKDICLFGRGLYPISVMLNRSGIIHFQDYNICRIITNDAFKGRDIRNIRAVDISDEMKELFLESIAGSLISKNVKEQEIIAIINEVYNNVYDLIGLKNWDCTLLPSGERTYDAREILHRINYICRRGKSDFAIELLNYKKVDKEVLEIIESYHKMGDNEVAEALNQFEMGVIPLHSWSDDRIIMLNFSGIIFFDEVGVIAGVIMKKYRDIEVILSCCAIEEEHGKDITKVSVRAREDVWKLTENGKGLADAKKVYRAIHKRFPKNFIQYGGHRWACSGVMDTEIVPYLFEEMVKYYEKIS
jgi:single-stranded DNA-specific DHH superfamily exonuclease